MGKWLSGWATPQAGLIDLLRFGKSITMVLHDEIVARFHEWSRPALFKQIRSNDLWPL
jgi:hypothetical protein